MKILSPLSGVSEAKPLIEAGAQELYCGVVTEEWEKRFSLVASANLRHDRVANFSSFEELAKTVDIASRRKVPVFCALNAHFYSDAQLPLALRNAQEAIDAGASKIIVSDIGLISLLKKKNFGADIALSTANPVFNSQAMPFFKRLGIRSIVLPRHLSCKEISGLAKSASALGIELEAFVLNAICPYIDGLCTLQHVGKSPDSIAADELACRIPFSVEVFSNEPSEQSKRSALARACLWQNTLPLGCGLCALPSFEKAGIHSLKIAGRGNSTGKKVADVKMLKEALGLLAKLPEKEFREEMHRFFFRANSERCGFTSCYYAGKGLW